MPIRHTTCACVRTHCGVRTRLRVGKPSDDLPNKKRINIELFIDRTEHIGETQIRDKTNEGDQRVGTG